jgi:two-component system cell cycle sensor histidine kinase/response regulator CckA
MEVRFLENGRLIKTILVVDDETELLAVIAQTLRRAGYEVLEACGVAEAVLKCEQPQIDLILSDFNLPGANGIILARKMESLRPNLPIIFMTGNHEACDELTAYGFLCLSKPFSFADMESVIRETLVLTSPNAPGYYRLRALRTPLC